MIWVVLSCGFTARACNVMIVIVLPREKKMYNGNSTGKELRGGIPVYTNVNVRHSTKMANS